MQAIGLFPPLANKLIAVEIRSKGCGIGIEGWHRCKGHAALAGGKIAIVFHIDAGILPRTVLPGQHIPRRHMPDAGCVDHLGCKRIKTAINPPFQ